MYLIALLVGTAIFAFLFAVTGAALRAQGKQEASAHCCGCPAHHEAQQH